MRSWMLVMVAVLMLVGCDRGADRRAAGDSAAAVPAERAPAGVFTTLPPPEARLVFVGRDSSILPDERPDVAFVPFSTFSVEREGIPNEFPAPDSMAAMLEAAGIGGDRYLIVGEPIPAGRAFAALDYLGLADRTALLDGGPEALASGEAAGAPAPAAGRLEIDPRRDMIVDAEWVERHRTSPGVAVLDARPPAEFSGNTPGEGVARPGHIPGARNVFWQTLVRSPDDTRLREEAELRRMLEAAGAAPGDTIVAYCRTGGQASFLYAVARHLGYETRLYDGSFVDWSRTAYPVER